MTDDTTAPEYWETFYADREPRWSGRANALLVEHTAGLQPGTALDLGCGQGGDALWLAGGGWTVTGVDVSASALAVAEEHAWAADLGGKIAWERHDLAESFPAGRFDLVAACYLQSPVAIPREEILRRAGVAVAPGGVLLIVSHAGWPAWVTDPDPAIAFRSAEGIVEDLLLPPGEWETEVVETVDRPVLDPDGSPATRPDNVVRVRRSGAGV